MRLGPIYLFFALLIVASGWLLLDQESPESLILGEWEEVAWKYEKLDHGDMMGFDIDKLQKQEICKNIIIHEAETWRFNPDGTLSFLDENEIKENLKWNIKGRGHILELHHKNNIVEDYQVVEVTEDELVVQFNSDLQVRGIVKMTFKRIPKKQYAQKI
ncbi:lipocalin family protein [Flagellimonas amoyensis]|uniref:lipocalin family protein n=1 Tax=Flagellimonas amoyensis TaxID=2169401 RepID=UPI00131F2018|nr:lipocalin family protein [Allomuricauda amoyensis]